MQLVCVLSCDVTCCCVVSTGCVTPMHSGPEPLTAHPEYGRWGVLRHRDSEYMGGMGHSALWLRSAMSVCQHHYHYHIYCLWYIFMHLLSWTEYGIEVQSRTMKARKVHNLMKFAAQPIILSSSFLRQARTLVMKHLITHISRNSLY